jgi:mannosyltransferase OCH1-like enzyme
MLHYGGIYLDLDNGCSASLEPLLYYSVFVTDGGHGALSNNILGAVPNHPFWRKLTGRIQSYAWKYPLPYLTVHWGTGQWFETATWEEYHADLKAGEEPLTRVMMDMRPGADRWVFFTQGRGGTWNQWDNELMMFVGDHIVCLGVGLGVTLGIAYSALRGLRNTRSRRRGYKRLGKHGGEVGLDDMKVW